MPLIRTELGKAFKNRWFVIALVIGGAFGAYAALELLPMSDYGEIEPNEFINYEANGCIQNWMSVWLMPAGELFYQLAPLLAVIPYAWSFASDRQSGYDAQIFTRTKRTKYLAAKFIAVWLCGGAVVVIPQLLNLLILACVFPYYVPSIAEAAGLTTGIFWNSIGSWLYYNIPLAYVGFYCLIDFSLCGAWAALTLGISCIVRNRVALLAAPYVVLMIAQFVNERLFLALGGIRGIQISLMENLYGFTSMYQQNGWVVFTEFLILAVGAMILTSLGSRRDVI